MVSVAEARSSVCDVTEVEVKVAKRGSGGVRLRLELGTSREIYTSREKAKERGEDPCLGVGDLCRERRRSIKACLSR